MIDDILNGGVVWFLVIFAITVALVVAVAGLMTYRRGGGLTQKLLAGSLGLTVLSFLLLVGYAVFLSGERPTAAAMTDNALATDAPDGESVPAARDEAADTQAAGDAVATGETPEDGEVSDGDVETPSNETPEIEPQPGE